MKNGGSQTSNDIVRISGFLIRSNSVPSSYPHHQPPLYYRGLLIVAWWYIGEEYHGPEWVTFEFKHPFSL